MESVPGSGDGGVYNISDDEEREDDDSEANVGAGVLCFYDGADEYKIGKTWYCAIGNNKESF